MYEFPEDLWYTPEGLWVSIAGNIATVGISDWLQDKMGDSFKLTTMSTEMPSSRYKMWVVK